MSTIIALSWQEHIEPVEFSAVAAATYRVFSTTRSKVYLLSENQTAISTIPCVSSLADINEPIDEVVLVGLVSDCTQQVRDLLSNANSEKDTKLQIRVVDTQNNCKHKEDPLAEYPNLKIDKEMVQSAASRCSILVSYLRDMNLQEQLQQIEIRFYLLKIFFDMCRNPNEIGVADLEAGNFLRYHCNDLKATFLPFDRLDDPSSAIEHGISSLMTAPAPAPAPATTLIDRDNHLSTTTDTSSSNKIRYKLETIRGNEMKQAKHFVGFEAEEVKQKIVELHAPEVLDFLKQAGDISASLGYEAYVAGGFVRDVLLGVLNQDIDLVVLGDGIVFADKLSEAVGVEVTHHREFGTAVVKLKDIYSKTICQKVDVATTRQEKYARPAALPEVQPSSLIWYDMERRDFTFNAMGIRITPPNFGSIIDILGGQEDLIKSRTLRILHPWSFVDDPTRLFRAIRFEQRMGYSMGSLTSVVFKKSALLGFASRLSGSRLSREIQLILSEERATAALHRLEEYKLLSSTVHASLATIPDAALKRVDRSLQSWKTQNINIQPWHVRFLALCSDLKDDVFDVVVKKLHLSEPLIREFNIIRALPRNFLEWFQSNESANPLPSKIYDILHSIPRDGLVYLWAELESLPRACDCITLFLFSLQSKKISVNGNDLRKIGIPPGPAYAYLLKRAHDALLDDEITSDRESQVRWVDALWKEVQTRPEFQSNPKPKSRKVQK